MLELSTELVRELVTAPWRLFYDSLYINELTQISQAKNSLMQAVNETENLRLKWREEIIMPRII